MRPRALSALALALAALAPAPAEAFVRSRGNPTGGQPGPELFWCTRRPSFVVNEAGSANAGPEETLAAVRRSFETWTQTGCSDLSFEDQGTTPRTDVGFDDEASDNQNLVVWREVACERVVPRTDSCILEGGCNNLYGCWEGDSSVIAVATVSFDNRTGEILDTDVEFNGAGFVFTTVDRPVCETRPVPGANDCVATDIENTMTHEVGHILGLDHSPDQASTMYASEPLGETSKRDLTDDDAQGICTIYPEGQKSSPVCPAEDPQGPNGGAGEGGGGGGGCSSGAGVSEISSVIAVLALLRALRKRRRSHQSIGGCRQGAR